MNAPILYMGDTSMDTAACYLAGVLTAFGVRYDYINSSQRCPDGCLSQDYRAVVLSDYPSINFTDDQLERLKNRVENGTGLVMIGGWESFVGQAGHYQKTALNGILPVAMQETDDRINTWEPCVVDKTAEHPIVASLPLEANLPLVGGYNQVTARPDALTVLSVRRYSVTKKKVILRLFRKALPPCWWSGHTARDVPRRS